MRKVRQTTQTNRADVSKLDTKGGPIRSSIMEASIRVAMGMPKPEQPKGPFYRKQTAQGTQLVMVDGLDPETLDPENKIPVAVTGFYSGDTKDIIKETDRLVDLLNEAWDKFHKG